ncbi:MAG: nucleotidyltransferase [Planctomycetota bacterium]
MNPDFRDMLSALNDAKVDFLVVGAYALSAHGMPRATGDIDLWVRPSVDNAQRVWQSLEAFRAPMSKVDVSDFAKPDLIYQIGLAPNRIDLLTSIDGVEFGEAWESHVSHMFDGVKVKVLSLELLRRNKLASGRPKDLIDAQWIDEIRGS